MFPDLDPTPRKRLDDDEPFPTFQEWLPQVSPNLRWDWPYTKLIAAELDRLDQPDTPEDNIMIFCPPRVGKSTEVTERHPLYVLERDPTEQVAVISYRQDLADKFSRATHRLARGRLVFQRDRNAVRNRELVQGGYYRAAGITSGINGEGFTRIYIDDPIKNREQADSPTYREKIWETWNDDLRTRRNPRCKVYLTVTRWHEDDLPGRILNSKEAKFWRVVTIPMEAEEDTYYATTGWLRKKGDLINPEHYPPYEVRRLKDGPVRTWNSLYQQQPTRKEGTLIKRSWFQFYDELPIAFDRICQSWDFAFKDTEGSSRVAGHVWGLLGADAYLIHRNTARRDFLSSLAAFIATTKNYPKARAKLIEDKANGPAVMRTIRRRIAGVIPRNPRGSKVERVLAVQPFLQSGNVYVPNPRYHPWVHEFLDECAAFPFYQTDDDVDAMTQALDYLLGGSFVASNLEDVAKAIRELSGDESGQDGVGWLDPGDPRFLAVPYR
jgi:predicted phage terminase large subunit-like protein